MKKSWICMLLLLCLTVATLASCVDSPMDKIPDDLKEYVVTDDEGNIVTDEQGDPVIEEPTSENEGLHVEKDDQGKNLGVIRGPGN